MKLVTDSHHARLVSEARPLPTLLVTDCHGKYHILRQPSAHSPFHSFGEDNPPRSRGRAQTKSNARREYALQRFCICRVVRDNPSITR